jgi:hypothetical protein
MIIQRKTRSFNLQVMTRLQDLSSDSFSCELYALDLAHQP